MIDFVADSDPSTPLDYAIAVGAAICAELVSMAGGLTAVELIDDCCTTISRIFRGYRVRKRYHHLLSKKIKKSKKSNSSKKEERPKFEINVEETGFQFQLTTLEDTSNPYNSDLNSGPQRPLSSKFPSSKVAMLGVDHSDTRRAGSSRRGSLNPLTMFTNRRPSNASFVSSGLTRSSMALNQVSVPFQTSSESEKEKAAKKIQRAWRLRQRKIEAKFLISMMGPEEASVMLEANFKKQREHIESTTSSAVSGGGTRNPIDAIHAQGHGHINTLGGGNKLGRRGSLTASRVLLFPTRPVNLSSRRGSFVHQDSFHHGPLFSNKPSPHPPDSTVKNAVEALEEYVSIGVPRDMEKEYSESGSESASDVQFQSGFRKKSSVKVIGRQVSRKKNPVENPDLTRVSSLTSKTISSTSKGNASGSIAGSLDISLTADEISFFRNVAQEYRSGGLKELKQPVLASKTEYRITSTRRKSLSSSSSTELEVDKADEVNNCRDSDDILYTIMSHDSSGPLQRTSTIGSKDGPSRLNSLKKQRKPSLTDEEMSYFLMMETEKRQEKENTRVDPDKASDGSKIKQEPPLAKKKEFQWNISSVADDSMSPEELAFFALMEQERLASQ